MPLVVLARTTTPSPLSTSTRRPARKPGIEPPWPAYLVPSTFQTCQPSPWAVVHGLAGVVVDRVRLVHLGERVRRQHLGRVAAGEGGPPREVLAPSSTAGRPGPSRRRRARARAAARRRTGAPRAPAPPGRWGGSSCGPCRAARAGRGGPPRTSRCRGPAPRAHRGPRSRRSCSGSAGQPGIAVPQAIPRGTCEHLPVAAGRALPPRPVRLGLHPGAVREQLRDRRAAELRAGHVVLEPVEQVEAAGVAQPHHGDGDERLGDGAHPVLRVGVGELSPGPPVERADGVGPRESAVPHDAGGDRRQAPAALLGREQVMEVAGGRRVDRARRRRRWLGRRRRCAGRCSPAPA